MQNEAGREEQPEGGYTYTLSLLVTTIATLALYCVLRKCKGRAARFKTILTNP